MLTSSVWAQVASVEVTNFNFKYQAPLGEGFADHFSYAQKTNQAQKVLVEKVAEDFKITLNGVENQEFTFSNPPSLLADAENIKLEGFNFSLGQRLGLVIKNGVFESTEKEVSLSGFNLSCDRLMGSAEVAEQLITGCIQKMNFQTGAFSTNGEGIESALMKAVDEKFDSTKAATTIKNVKFKIAAGKFDLSADIKAQISGSAKGSGTVKYDSAAKMITIKVSEIKFSILDVTSQVFAELKKQESSNVKVKQPYIYVTVK